MQEPRLEEALEMLHGVKTRYETHHGVVIADEALEAAVKLSVGWLPDRHLPVPQSVRSPGRGLRPRPDRSISKPADKMVGLVVTARTVAEVLGEWKRISAEALLRSDKSCTHRTTAASRGVKAA